MDTVVDFIIDGMPHGDVANEFADCNYNSGLWRPFIDRNGNKCVMVNRGLQYNAEKGRDVTTYEKMTFNEARLAGFDTPTLYLSNAALLSKDEWKMFDTVVLEASRQRLRVWSDLAAANTYTLDGMSNKILEHETINDPGEALVDMDGLADGRADRHLYQLEGLPLPFTYQSFYFGERDLAVSRKRGTPLSTLMADTAGRRVSEVVEKTTIGVTTGITYGTTANYGRAPTVYGLTNHPARNYGTNLTTPTSSNPDVTVSEVLAMRSTLYDDGMYGPYVIYNGTDWDRYLDDDYFVLASSGATAPSRTLRQRLQEIEGIQSVRRADYLSPTLTGGTYDLLMVSLGDPKVCRAVIGMPIRVLQWPSRGGMQLNFKVMCIMAPQIRADYNGNSGINHESVT